MATSRTTIFAPGSVTGFASARSKQSLSSGVMSQLYDVRLSDGTVRTRWGSSNILAAINGTDTYRGSFECIQDGTKKLFVALSNGTYVSIWVSTNGGTSWTNISPTSGAWGDTRLSDVGPVYFSLINDKGSTSYDCLIIQNGVDSPRVYSTNKGMSVSAPDTTTIDGYVTYGFRGYDQFATAPTCVASGGSAVTTPTYNGQSYVQLKFNSTATTTANITVQLASVTGSLKVPLAVPTGSAYPQWQFLVAPQKADGTYDPLWRNVKIEVSDAALGSPTWLTVYDGSQNVVTATDDQTNYLIAVPATTFSGINIGTYKFRFTWNSSTAPGHDFYMNVYLVAMSGSQQGTTAYSLALASSSTRTIAPSKVITRKIIPSFCGITLPIATTHYYQLTVGWSYPSFTAPYDYVNIYRNDVGSNGYYYATQIQAYAYSGSWSSTGTSSWIDGDLTVSNVTTDYTREAPWENSQPLPVGTAMAALNNRLMVCGGNRFYYSDDVNPFVFSKLVRYDTSGNAIATSSGSFSRTGETFQQIVSVGALSSSSEQLGTPQTGAMTCYVLTDKGCYALSGFNALSLNKTINVGPGTRSPFSVAVIRNSFYYLDDQYQVRMCQYGQTKAISKYLVDDWTKAIPQSRVQWVSGACVDERYYMAFTPVSGSTNTRVLVWNDSIGWESVDRSATPVQGFRTYYDTTANRTKLLAFSTTGLFEYSQPGLTTEFGAQITSRIEGSQYTNAFNSINFGGLYAMVDYDASGTMTFSTISVNGPSAGTITASTVPLAGSGAQAIIAVRTRQGFGSNTIAAQPIIEWTASGGTRIYRAEMEMQAGSENTVQGS